MTERRYLLEIDETQAAVLNRAADLLAQIQTGQFQEIATQYVGRGVSAADLDEARTLLDRLHVLLTGLAPTAGLSVLHPKVPDSARIAYDLHQVLCQRGEPGRPDAGGSGVWRGDPLKTSPRPLARLSEIKPQSGAGEP
jgi:hypothetical protein